MELMRWAGAQAHSDEPVGARRTRNLVSGGFLGIGAILGFFALLVIPGWDVSHRTTIVVLAIVVGLGSLSQLLFASATPVATNHVTSVLSAALIAAVQILAGDPVAIAMIGLLYVWVAVLVSLYYSVLAASAHLAALTIAQIVVAVWLGRMALIPQVVLTAGTCITVGVIVMLLTRDMRAQLVTDPLTTLVNRRGLEQSFAREIATASREGQTLAVVALDLDAFKQLNDSFGHAEGDRVLIETAHGWRGCLRPQDTLARLGGDEFVALLPGCGIGRVGDVVSRLIALTPSPVRASAGVAMFCHGEQPSALLARADAALYRAKAAGGGQHVIDGG